MTTENSLSPFKSDLLQFSREEIERAGELLGCPLDEASALRALIIQRDTGLSLARGELSVVPFGGKPTVFINKQGYLAYAARQPEYDGFEYGIREEAGDTVAWCKVFRKDRTRPTYDTARMKEDRQKSQMWERMPRRMLEKVAIKRAHQAAFPMLNGLLIDEEIEEQPYKVQRRCDDIDVTPAEDKQLAKYSLLEAQTVRDNMVSQNMDTAVFAKARLPGNMFDKAMIDEDFKRQLEQKRAAPAKPAKLEEPEPAQKPDEPKQETDKTEPKKLTTYTCADCGKIVLPQEATPTIEKYGVPICPNCREKRLLAAIKTESKPEQTALEETPTETPETPKYEQVNSFSERKDGIFCSECGAEITKLQHDTSKLFTKRVLCKACMKNLGGK